MKLELTGSKVRDSIVGALDGGGGGGGLMPPRITQRQIGQPGEESVIDPLQGKL